jgi:hypothetical protein
MSGMRFWIWEPNLRSPNRRRNARHPIRAGFPKFPGLKRKSPRRSGSRDREIDIESRKPRKSGPKAKELPRKTYKTSNPRRSKSPKRNSPSNKGSRSRNSYKSTLTRARRSNRTPFRRQSSNRSPHSPPPKIPAPHPTPQLQLNPKTFLQTSPPILNPQLHLTPRLHQKFFPKTPKPTDEDWSKDLEQNLQIKVLSSRLEDDFLKKT